MMKKASYLYNGLPCVWDGEKYVIFSPYSFKLARLSPDELEKSTTVTRLRRLNFFGTPSENGNTPDNIKITLITTTDCNLRCKYCHMNGGDKANKRYMDPKVAIDAIDGMIKLKPNAREIYVTFFGGEPTLNMKTVKRVVNFIKSTQLKARFHISTNGIFSEATLKYFSDNKFDITISADGVPKVNNRYRIFPNGTGTAEKIEETIKQFVRRKLHFNVRMSVAKHNVINIPQAIEYFSSLGVRFIHLELIKEEGRAKRKGIRPPHLKTYLKYFKQGIKECEEKKVFILNSSLMNLLTPSTYFCSSAKGDMYVITPEGKISLCYEIQNSSPDYFDFIVGEVNGDGIKINDASLNKMCSINVNRLASCEGCFARYICGGGCPLRNLTTTGSLFIPSPSMCQMRREIIQDAVLSLYNASRQNRISPVIGTAIYENRRLLDGVQKCK